MKRRQKSGEKNMRGSSEAVVQRIERELVERGNEAEIDKTKAVHTPIVQLLKG